MSKKITFKSEILSIVMIVVSIIFSVYFFLNFPEQVVVHWNYQGEPDAWASRALAAFMIIPIIIGVYFLFIFLPKFDPKRDKYVHFEKTYRIIRNSIVSFLTLIYLITGFNNLGYNLPIDKIIPVLVGILFMIIGNYMGKVKSNWFLGFRTPWTLSSDEVWNKTHRAGGKLFMLVGAIIAFSIFLPSYLKAYIVVISSIILVFGVMIYSYFLYRKELKK